MVAGDAPPGLRSLPAIELLRQRVQPHWAERYRSGWDDTRLPSKQAERDALVAQVGVDSLALLQAALADDAPAGLRFRECAEKRRLVVPARGSGACVQPGRDHRSVKGYPARTSP